MSWGTSNNGGSAWESTPDASWPTADPTASAAAEPTVDNDNNGVHDTTDKNAAPSGDKPEAPAGEPSGQGANAQWSEQEKLKYNYEEYDAREGEYDGNARVYHWDGEEGDIGPEFPELEVEIFGPPDQRIDELCGPEIAR